MDLKEARAQRDAAKPHKSVEPKPRGWHWKEAELAQVHVDLTSAKEAAAKAQARVEALEKSLADKQQEVEQARALASEVKASGAATSVAQLLSQLRSLVVSTLEDQGPTHEDGATCHADAMEGPAASAT